MECTADLGIVGKVPKLRLPDDQAALLGSQAVAVSAPQQRLSTTPATMHARAHQLLCLPGTLELLHSCSPGAVSAQYLQLLEQECNLFSCR